MLPFHRALFEQHLPSLQSSSERARRFVDYLQVMFRLHRPEELGWRRDGPKKRINATCLRMIRGWSADSSGREGAVLKGWVQSRFGLNPVYHKGPLVERDDEWAEPFVSDLARGLFATNALESQLDLLYAYCQYELLPRWESSSTMRLYRGIVPSEGLCACSSTSAGRYVMLMNNLSSFTSERERAEEFGYWILEVDVPLSKIFFFNRLVPQLLTGEDEFMVLGGLYDVRLQRM